MVSHCCFDFSSVQSLRHVQLFATPWTTACQASLSITNCQSLPILMSIESVMPSNHLILCRPLLPPSIFPSIRVFSSESVLRIRWPKYWNFSVSISPSSEHQDWFPLGWTGWVPSLVFPCQGGFLLYQHLSTLCGTWCFYWGVIHRPYNSPT